MVENVTPEMYKNHSERRSHKFSFKSSVGCFLENHVSHLTNEYLSAWKIENGVRLCHKMHPCILSIGAREQTKIAGQVGNHSEKSQPTVKLCSD